MVVENRQQIGEGGVALGQVGQRGVGGVARVTVFFRPALAGAVSGGDGAAGAVEVGEETSRRAELVAINVAYKCGGQGRHGGSG